MTIRYAKETVNESALSNPPGKYYVDMTPNNSLNKINMLTYELEGQSIKYNK